MKQRNSIVAIAGLLLSLASQTWAANTKQSVTQVSATVELTANVDYFVSSATPFGEAGVVNIVNTDHAVLILSNVKPSEAIPMLAAHVQINGAKAVNNTNCQVKLYNRGSIILPYGNSTKPLTVYSEQNFGGESCNNFGLENSGGYMNTLSDAKLNNKIRSFKLKRGYMVTFSNLPNGRGYSRCFIAAYNDLEISELPAVMDQKISSYRVFKWYDTGKKHLANYMNKDAMSALNVQSSYDWGQGNNSFLPDYEWVPNHIYEDYPSSATIGSTSQSPHCKNNNEPLNTADDTPQDLKTILGNWENMMRTGLRLCSPASWDGSDYDNATGFLAEFLDSIDARGWRCDIIDLHCYWPEGKFNNLHNWTDKYKRPIWISEWCWGASWNNNGAFANNVTEAQVKTALQNICAKLNGYDYVERYYYWNGERDPSKLYKNGTLTPAGEYYSNMTTGLAYNDKYDFVPKTPKQYGPSKFASKTTEDGKLQLQWYDPNGEFNQLMEVQKKDENGKWITYQVVEQKDAASNYTLIITEDTDAEYRIHMIDLNGKEYFSSEEKSVGDQMEVGDDIMYLGGNVIFNGDFDYGFAGWENGEGNDLSAPYFEVVKTGGFDGGAYLQAFYNGNSNTAMSVKKVIELTDNTNYYIRMANRNGSKYQSFYLSKDGVAESKNVLEMSGSTKWNRLSKTFNTGNYSKGLLSFQYMGSKAQVDKVELRQLFSTREEAVANGVALAKTDAEAIAAANTRYPSLSNELNNIVSNITTNDDIALKTIEQAVNNHQKAIRYMEIADSLNTVLNALASVKCVNYNVMKNTLEEALMAESAETVFTKLDEVRTLMNTYLAYSDADVQPKSPKFANDTETGWTTKAGTYTAGDQRINKDVGGKTCWNAWWSLSAKDNPTATMEIKQTIDNLAQGIYTLECKATTQHYCLSDQHGYLKYFDKTVETPHLTFDYFDLPVDNIWETLTTAPIFVNEGDAITIGFVGSKNGAIDNQWHQLGDPDKSDNREGWWCATDFVLKYHPAYRRTTEANQWGTICLPYSFRGSDDITLYKIIGITSDYTKLCLEEIDESAAGEPCLFYTTAANPIFAEYGKAVKSANSNGDGNLKGFFETASKTPKNYYYFSDGVFTKVTGDRPAIGNYCAVMRPLDDKLSNQLTEYETWEGVTIPIIGITDQEKAVNSSIAIPKIKSAESFYTLDGRRLQAAPTKKGIYILNGRKVVVR